MAKKSFKGAGADLFLSDAPAHGTDGHVQLKDLRINPVFKELIPPLSPEEYAQLEENLLQNGVREAISLWGDTIIDGHNRYKIAREHNLDFNTMSYEFESESDAVFWIIKNQFGRRNLSAYDRSLLALKLKPIIAARAKENQIEAGGAVSEKSLKKTPSNPLPDSDRPLRQNSAQALSDTGDWPDEGTENSSKKTPSNPLPDSDRPLRQNSAQALSGTGDWPDEGTENSSKKTPSNPLPDGDRPLRQNSAQALSGTGDWPDEISEFLSNKMSSNPLPDSDGKLLQNSAEAYNDTKYLPDKPSENSPKKMPSNPLPDSDGKLWQNSAQAYIKTRDELAQIAGVSHDTISKVEIIERSATPEVKSRLKRGEISIHKAYLDTRRKEKKNSAAFTLPKPPEEKFDVLYASLPLDSEGMKGDKHKTRYPAMKLEDIKKLDIPADKDSVLLLWATAPLLPQALEVMKSWGFIYKSQMIWDKESCDVQGFWTNEQHEILLIGKKGGFKAFPKSKIASVYREKADSQSAKPKYFYSIIEQMFPNMRYLELFAREKHSDQWTAWGGQINSEDGEK